MESFHCTIVGKNGYKSEQESDSDSGFERTSACSLENLDEEEEEEEAKVKKFSEEDEVGEKMEEDQEEEEKDETNTEEKLKRLMYNFLEENIVNELNSMEMNEARKFMKSYLKKFDVVLDEFTIDIMIFEFRPGATNSSVPPRPDWLDMDKFRKGQKFARDYLAAVFYSQLHGLMFLFSFVDDLKTLIFTGKSHTPYLAFKRYLSTGIRVRNWFREDPWTEGTAAYKDIQAVRKMHNAVAEHIEKLDCNQFAAACALDNPVCPMFNVVAKDLADSCSIFGRDQCPYMFIYDSPRKLTKLNQSSMAVTLFGFMALTILYPTDFGMHQATDEELENFCHVWRAIGYLLGVDDECNVCRGSLEEVRERARKFIKFWIKPNLGRITKEWEHMVRCVVQGSYYYFFSPTYENLVLNMTEMLDIPMPNLYASLTYPQWIFHYVFKFMWRYCSRIHLLRYIANAVINYYLDRALRYDKEKHEELKKNSAKWMKNFS